MLLEEVVADADVDADADGVAGVVVVAVVVDTSAQPHLVSFPHMVEPDAEESTYLVVVGLLIGICGVDVPDDSALVVIDANYDDYVAARTLVDVDQVQMEEELNHEAVLVHIVLELVGNSITLVDMDLGRYTLEGQELPVLETHHWDQVSNPF